MNVTIVGTVTHLCPYVDEVDEGTVTVDYWPDGEGIELHFLAALFDSYRGRRITHEAVVQDIADRLANHQVAVTGRWRTAGLEMECRAVSSVDVQPADA